MASASKLRPHVAFVDSTNLIRVVRRPENSILDFDARHPIVLPKLRLFTKTPVKHFSSKVLTSSAALLSRCHLAVVFNHRWASDVYTIIRNIKLAIAKLVVLPLHYESG